MLKICPPPAATIFGAMTRVTYSSPLTLVSIMASQSRVSPWSMCSSPAASPALLTSRSTRPSGSRFRRTSSSERTSNTSVVQRPPAASISAFSAARRSARRPVTVTAYPSFASRSAAARPMPDVAPVIRASFFISNPLFAAKIGKNERFRNTSRMIKVVLRC